MNIKEKYHLSKSGWLRLVAIGGLSSLTVFAFYQQAQAGPITGGAGNAPFVKLGVYQGLVSIVPGNVGDSVMEIGNAGRDIKTTGALNLFPATGSNVTVNETTGDANLEFNPNGTNVSGVVGRYQVSITNGVCAAGDNTDGNSYYTYLANGAYHVNCSNNSDQFFVENQFVDAQAITMNANKGIRFLFGDATANGQSVALTERVRIASNGNLYVPQICFGNSTSTDCETSWVGLGGGSQTLDQVLAAGNTASNKSAIFLSQAIDGKSIITTSGAATPVQTGTDSFAFLVPRLSAILANHYNDVVVANDSGLFFSEDTGFVIGGWNLTGTANRIKGARFNGANVTGAALAVNNQGGGWFTAGLGSVGDGVYAKVNSTNAAISGEQLNSSGWAGYFSGNVNVTGTTQTAALTLAGLPKNLRVQICQRGSATCIGDYAYTVTNANPALVQLCAARDNCNTAGHWTGDCYNAISDVAPSPFECVNLYSAANIFFCPRDYETINTAGAGGKSYYTSLANCQAAPDGTDEKRIRILGTLTNPHRASGSPFQACQYSPAGPWSQGPVTITHVKAPGLNCVTVDIARDCGGVAGNCQNTVNYETVIAGSVQTGYTQTYEVR